MLDSLVRVSRRVAGAADLLATEMLPVPEKTLGIRGSLNTRRERGKQKGAQPNESKLNFTLKQSPVPAVRCVNEGRNAARRDRDRRSKPLLVKTPRAKPNQA